MRVLVANKFWYRRGGLESVMFEEVMALTALGAEIAHFSTAHPDNDDSPWSDYFAPYLELGADWGLSAGEKLKALGRLFHNGVAKASFARLLADFEPDVVHIHGIHRQLSPSILTAARAAGVPVVQSLHDCHHICPEDNLLRAAEHRCVPPRCSRFWYGPAVGNRCVRGSAVASAVSAAETAFQRMRGAYDRGVTRFISPSRFLAEQMEAGGWTVPIDIVSNPVAPSGAPAAGPGEGAVYIGRLSREKGVGVALEAARRAGIAMTVVGEGPQERELRAAYPDATFVGRVGRERVDDHVRASRAVVVPSVCVENAPMAVLEAMAAGRAVVASDVGGVSELVEHGRTGLLVPPDDPGALATALGRLHEEPEFATRLGTAGHAETTGRFSPGAHAQAILRSYRLAQGGAVRETDVAPADGDADGEVRA